MKEYLYNFFVSQSGTLTTKEIIISFAAALIIGFIIFVSYRFSHTGSVYSSKFNVSLIMLVLVTTMIMSVIGNNIALSLGMVGALSIVRFRTAIKDSRDTAYIFWCIAVGICCGISDFMVAGIGSGVIFVVMLILGNVKNNDRFLLVVRGTEGSDAVNKAVSDYYKGKACLRVDNSSKNSIELIFEVSRKAIDSAVKRNDSKSIKEKLFEVKGIEEVNIICQNDEIAR